jgi:hypothetical protein
MRAASELPRVTRPARVPRTLLESLLLLAAILAAGAVSVLILKQDANWDLQNYHFYNAWAFVHGRMGWDLAPAQLQTFHNPLVEMPFYWMVSADWPPRWISFVMAIPAGVGLFFLGKIVLLLFADLPTRERRACVVVAIAVGATATSPVSLLGSTINEWQGATLVTIALWLVLRRADEPAIGWRALAAAGLLCGIASGLKLTAATYALGLCVALIFRSGALGRGLREAVGFAAAVVAGLALSLGAWMWTLDAHFGSPMFPYYNEWFHSPWWDASPLIERVYGPKTLFRWLTYPLPLLGFSSGYVTELRFRDWRLPLAYLVCIAGAVAWIARRWRHRSPDRKEIARGAWRTLLAFWVVSFTVWALLHSIYRYLLPLELLIGAVTIHLLRSMVLPRWMPAAAITYAVLAIATVRYPDWWHVEYGKRYFEVEVPPVAPRAVVLLTSDAPMAYVLPFFPPDARFLGAKNNLNDPQRTNRLEREIEKIVRDHDGPLYSLTFPRGAGADVLAAHRLRVELPGRDCALVWTNMSVSPLQLCRVARSAPAR